MSHLILTEGLLRPFWCHCKLRRSNLN